MAQAQLRTPMLIVTGATGWLGSRVIEAVTAGLGDIALPPMEVGKVRVIVPVGERLQGLIAGGVEVVQGDIRDTEAVTDLLSGAGDGVLIHLAGIIHPAGRTAAFRSVNCDATLALHGAAANAGIRRMVVMSSNSPIGYNPRADHLFDETSAYNPYMGYGRSKMAMEQGLLARMAEDNGPETVILRAPWFYGPGQPPRQTQFFTMIKNGAFPVFGNGENRRSMGYTDNLVQGVMLAATKAGAAGEIYWLADERAYAMNEIIASVRKVLRDDFGLPVKERGLRLPSFIADTARLADGALQGMGLYHQKIHVLSEMNLTIACDVSKAKRELGYRPTVALAEGMRRSVAWCLQNGHTI